MSMGYSTILGESFTKFHFTTKCHFFGKLQNQNLFIAQSATKIIQKLQKIKIFFLIAYDAIAYCIRKLHLKAADKMSLIKCISENSINCISAVSRSSCFNPMYVDVLHN